MLGRHVQVEGRAERKLTDGMCEALGAGLGLRKSYPRQGSLAPRVPRTTPKPCSPEEGPGSFPPEGSARECGFRPHRMWPAGPILRGARARSQAAFFALRPRRLPRLAAFARAGLPDPTWYTVPRF